MIAKSVYCILGCTMFAVMAYVHFRWAFNIHRFVIMIGKRFRDANYESPWDVGYYRMLGWLFAICSVAMAIAEVLVLVDA